MATTFSGEPCQKCGCTDRLVCDKRCLDCHRERCRLASRRRRILRDELRDAGKSLVYDGDACLRCNDTSRYVSSKACVTCQANATSAYFIKRKYGLSPTQYRELLVSQGFSCRICRVTPLGDEKLCVDHDHQTGAVRGLLCRKCNSVLGFVDDNPAVLIAAIAYLKEHHDRL